MERRNAGGNLNANFTLLNYWGGWFGAGYAIGGQSPTTLRGGPAINVPGGLDAWLGIETDERKSISAGVNGWFYLEDETDSWAAGFGPNVSWRPAANIDFRISPRLNFNIDEWQYFSTEEVNDVDEYIFGELHQKTFSMTVRGNVTFSPTLSLQLYAQPFVSTGRYEGFKRVATAKVEPFLAQFENFEGDQVINDDGEISLDFDADGTAEVELDNPDFTFLSFRSNLVLRWEYNLGSTIFLVWQHGRSEDNTDRDFNLGSSFGKIFSAEAENVLLLKVNYWISP
jgi:hypothetical protein